jgi:hypothetical protein
MNVIPEECLVIDRPRRSSHSLPVDASPPIGIIAEADGSPPADNFAAHAETRSPIRGRLIVIAFVAAAPIAIGAWLWLLGRVALALL